MLLRSNSSFLDPSPQNDQPERKRDVKAQAKQEKKGAAKQQKPKTTRPKKSQEQVDALCKLYHELGGKKPTSEQIKKFAEEHKMKANLVYKWFWDMK